MFLYPLLIFFCWVVNFSYQFEEIITYITGVDFLYVIYCTYFRFVSSPPWHTWEDGHFLCNPGFKMERKFREKASKVKRNR